MTLLWTETWASTNCHMYGTKFYRTLQHFNLKKPTPPAPTGYQNSTAYNSGGSTTIFLGGIPCGGATITPLSFFTPPHTLLTPNTLQLPNFPVSVVPSLVSTHIYLFSITFALRPDKVATVWSLQKLVSKYHLIALFQQIRSYHIMDSQHVALNHMTKMVKLSTSWSKLVFSGTVHLVVLVDKLSTTAVVFFRSERRLKCKHLYGACSDASWEVWKVLKSENPKGEGKLGNEKGGCYIVRGYIKLNY